MQNGSAELETPMANDGSSTKPSLWRRLRSHIHMRPPEDDDPQSWWIASTAIPLIAAAAGPLANVMSIVALVMPWRSEIVSMKLGPANTPIQHGYPDPPWALALNAVSVVCGIVGNLFLLFNFTKTVRYVIALPASIILWFLAMAILVGLTVAVNIYAPPVKEMHVYSQAYWSAVIAACLYCILSCILMINMLGYFLGRYPQHFLLTDEQRTLILQTTALVTWLLIGAAIFHKVMDISFADALYFCDITVLTLGFGDVVATTALGRGLVWPYAVFGVIMLGLVVGSILQFAQEIHYDKVVRKHIAQKREATVERTVTFDELDADQREHVGRTKEVLVPPKQARRGTNAEIVYERHHHRPIHISFSALTTGRRPKLLVLKEEKDRFDAMRKIQRETLRFWRWNDLLGSSIAFAIVWTMGALVFSTLEEDLSYFAALYFCFVCLLTIGYGDITPQSNAGRPFFIVWSLIAIPTMTMLIAKMSDTVVASFKNGTNTLANWVVLPKKGIYTSLLSRIPVVKKFVHRDEDANGGQQDDAEGGNKPSSSHRHSAQDHPCPTIEELAREPIPSSFELAQQLAGAIRRTTHDVIEGKQKWYSYEEWVEFVRLIRFTDPKWRPSSSSGDSGGSITVEEDEFGVINWDWIGENSPMLAEGTEPEWVLDRLCESLQRYVSKLDVSKQEHARSEKDSQGKDEGEEATPKEEKDHISESDT